MFQSGTEIKRVELKRHGNYMFVLPTAEEWLYAKWPLAKYSQDIPEV
jgi:hypothetical protein